MNNQRHWVVLTAPVLVFGAVLSSCATPQQLEIIEREQRRLRAEASNVRGETTDIRGEFDRVRSSLADTRANLQEVQRDLNSLKGKVDELKYMMDRQIGSSNRDKEQKLRSLEDRLAKMEEGLTEQSNLLKAQEDGMRGLRESWTRANEEKKDASLAKGTQGADSGAGTTVAEPDGVKKDYETALKVMDQKDYRQAIIRFREFLKKNPSSEFADNAQYWIGECHYALKEFDQAILEFDQVRRKYPKGDKVPAALLKQGFAFAELGDRLDARLILQELIDRYPLSAEATRAKGKLKSLQS
jgi:tol-pal system protein YbgF